MVKMRVFFLRAQSARHLGWLLLLITLGFPKLNGQLTIRIESWPPFPPPNDRLYIAGNFNSWNPGNPTYELTLLPNDQYAITFNPPAGNLEFKFTRGNWETVECLANGGFRPNRTLAYDGNPDTLHLAIDGWADLNGEEDTTEPNVAILDDDFFIPQLNRNRRIWIYLPPDYESSGKHYPVLYMQDGQNLFDQSTSFAGEWRIDESMNALFDMGDFGAIVVGIDNGGSHRIAEYTPWRHTQYGGGDGELYAAFLAETLKPWIDSQYRTLPGRLYTAVGGSSLGGLIALYTAVEHQDLFGKALVLSPSFWFSDSTYLHVAERGVPADMRIYMAAGTSESPGMIPDMQAMADLLIAEGISPDQVRLESDPAGSHSESWWALEYPDGYAWLFEQAVSTPVITNHRLRTAFPNPSSDTVNLDLSADAPNRVVVVSPWGREVPSRLLQGSRIDVSDWPAGIYFIQVWYAGQPGPDIFRVVRTD